MRRASRLNQFVQKLMCEWEIIRRVKEYRTPHVMRAYARFYTMFVLPAIIAPTILHKLLDGETPAERAALYAPDDEMSRLAFACFFAALVSGVLTGLIEVQASLEDPFSSTVQPARRNTPPRALPLQPFSTHRPRCSHLVRAGLCYAWIACLWRAGVRQKGV